MGGLLIKMGLIVLRGGRSFEFCLGFTRHAWFSEPAPNLEDMNERSPWAAHVSFGSSFLFFFSFFSTLDCILFLVMLYVTCFPRSRSRYCCCYFTPNPSIYLSIFVKVTFVEVVRAVC